MIIEIGSENLKENEEKMKKMQKLIKHFKVPKRILFRVKSIQNWKNDYGYNIQPKDPKPFLKTIEEYTEDHCLEEGEIWIDDRDPKCIGSWVHFIMLNKIPEEIWEELGSGMYSNVFDRISEETRGYNYFDTVTIYPCYFDDGNGFTVGIFNVPQPRQIDLERAKKIIEKNILSYINYAWSEIEKRVRRYETKQSIKEWERREAEKIAEMEVE